MSKAGKKTTRPQAEKPAAQADPQSETQAQPREEPRDEQPTAAADPAETAEMPAADTIETSAEEDAAVEPDPLEALAAERDLFQEKWLRVVAELDNVRKRSSRELIQTRKFAEADVLRSFLEIQDNFERALHSGPDEGDTEAEDGFRAGIELIYQRLRGLFKERNVTPMEVLNKEFDPNFHDAVGQLPREGVEPGLVIEVVQQGYHFGDTVLRPARVIISA